MRPEVSIDPTIAEARERAGRAVEPAIELSDVWASFRVFEDRAMTLRDRLSGRRTKATEHWALQGLDVEIAPGDAVAIVGANGSGKSTLLKLLARIFPPTHGDVTVRGRVAPMLELGAGFHGDLSGRENVYLNAAILGYSAAKVDAVYDDIVAFAELEEFMDRPVRTYSSGMYLRLGFAVSVHLEPDVLLIDEVLAVGDATFGLKCINRLRELRRRGVTIVLVSHDLATVETLCDTAIYLDRGTLRKVGPTNEIISLYQSDIDDKVADTPTATLGENFFGSGEIQIDGAEISDADGNSGTSFPMGSRLEVVIEATVLERVADPCVGMIIRTADGLHVYDTNSLWRKHQTGVFEPGDKIVARYGFDLCLLPGSYTMTCSWSRDDGCEVFAWRWDAVIFEVTGTPNPAAIGLVDLQADLRTERNQATTLGGEMAATRESVERDSIKADSAAVVSSRRW